MNTKEKSGVPLNRAVEEEEVEWVECGRCGFNYLIPSPLVLREGEGLGEKYPCPHCNFGEGGR